LQEHVELQQLRVAELLTAAHLELSLEELPPLAGIPAQLAEQHLALLQQVAAPQGNGHAGRVAARLELLESLQVGLQVGVGGEPVAAGVVKGPLQVGALLGTLPAQPPQLQIDLGQLAAPVLRIGGRFLARLRPGRRRRRFSRWGPGIHRLGELRRWRAFLRGRSCRPASGRCGPLPPRARQPAGLRFTEGERGLVPQPSPQPGRRPVLGLLGGGGLAQGTAQEALGSMGGHLHHATAGLGVHQTGLQLHRPGLEGPFLEWFLRGL
ncbi:MAG: hypothetical protein ACK5PF_11760, partial [bacterium]